MKQVEADVAIIGAGTAGMTAFRAAREHASRVVLIEGDEFGTTCARVGCMPSKLLIAAADAAQAVAASASFGIEVAGRRIDGAAVMRRVRAERDRFVGHVVQEVRQWPAEQVLHGRARFLDPHTLEVGGGIRVRADRVVIATGSRPQVPAPWRDQLGDRLLVSDDLFDWTQLPTSLAVVGAGVVGLELAQALHRLGVRVCLYGKDARLGPLTDPVLQELSRKIIRDELPLALDSGELELARTEGGISVRSHNHKSERYEYLLAATGRAPATHGLNLAAAGEPTENRLRARHDRHTCQLGDSHVFVAGDASQDRPLLHEAAEEGRIAGENAGRFPDVRSFPRRTPMTVVFTDPQIMLIGASYAQLIREDIAFAVGEVSFEEQGRSRVIARNQGALRVYGEQGSGRLLGAEMIGPHAEHMAHLLAWCVQRQDTVEQILAYPFYHPVIEEGVRSGLRSLRRRLRMGPVPVSRSLDCGPGA